MKRTLLALLCGVAMTCGALDVRAEDVARGPRAVRTQEADPKPPNGIAGIIVGHAALGLGAFNLATIPVCFADFYPDRLETACLASSIAIGVGGLAAGVAGLVIGHRRRAAYKAWRERQQTGLRFRGGELAGAAGRAELRLRFTF